MAVAIAPVPTTRSAGSADGTHAIGNRRDGAAGRPPTPRRRSGRRARLAGRRPSSTSRRKAARRRARSRRPAGRSVGRTGGRSGVSPSRSCSTSTWPSVPPPAPMPIVGMRRRSVIARATRSGTLSSTTAKQPASSRASASSSERRAAAAVRPWARKPPSAARSAAAGRRGPSRGCRRARCRPPCPPSASALELHRVHAAFLQEAAGVAHRLRGVGLVAHERHVADEQGARAPRATARAWWSISSIVTDSVPGAWPGPWPSAGGTARKARSWCCATCWAWNGAAPVGARLPGLRTHAGRLRLPARRGGRFVPTGHAGSTTQSGRPSRPLSRTRWRLLALAASSSSERGRWRPSAPGWPSRP